MPTLQQVSDDVPFLSLSQSGLVCMRTSERCEVREMVCVCLYQHRGWSEVLFDLCLEMSIRELSKSTNSNYVYFASPLRSKVQSAMDSLVGNEGG